MQDFIDSQHRFANCFSIQLNVLPRERVNIYFAVNSVINAAIIMRNLFKHNCVCNPDNVFANRQNSGSFEFNVKSTHIQLIQDIYKKYVSNWYQWSFAYASLNIRLPNEIQNYFCYGVIFLLFFDVDDVSSAILLVFTHIT